MIVGLMMKGWEDIIMSKYIASQIKDDKHLNLQQVRQKMIFQVMHKLMQWVFLSKLLEQHHRNPLYKELSKTQTGQYLASNHNWTMEIFARII